MSQGRREKGDAQKAALEEMYALRSVATRKVLGKWGPRGSPQSCKEHGETASTASKFGPSISESRPSFPIRPTHCPPEQTVHR